MRRRTDRHTDGFDYYTIHFASSTTHAKCNNNIILPNASSDGSDFQSHLPEISESNHHKVDPIRPIKVLRFMKSDSAIST